MEIIESLFSDKKTVIIMTIAYVIVMVVALIIIWKPDTVLEVSKYEPYNEEEKKQEMATYYFGTLRTISAYQLKSGLDNIISKSYLDYSEKNIDDIMVKLSSPDSYPQVTNVKSYNAGDKVIYSANLETSRQVVPICIIENSPYVFELTLDNFVAYDLLNKSTSKDGIEVKVEDVYQSVEFIQYKLYIENTDAEYVTMDFSKSTNVYLTLDDSKVVYLKNVYDTPELKYLEKNGVANRELMFNVPISEQDKIQSIYFKNVIVDGKKIEVEIKLY